MSRFPDIKPCPFCGGPASVEDASYAQGVGAWTVSCDADELACMGFDINTSFARKIEAIEAWNRRAPVAKE